MKETRQLRPGENLFAVVMLIFSLLVFKEAYEISGFSSISAPGSIPMGAAAVMVISMIAQMIGNRKCKKPNFPGLKAELSYAARETFPSIFFVYVFVILIYVILIKPIHFTPSSFLFLLASIILLKGASIKKSVLISVGMLACIYIIFHYFFRVLLP